MPMDIKNIFGIASILFFTTCCSLNSIASNEPKQNIEHVEYGIASWYSIKTNRGTKTASGKKLCDNALTAAHRTLPFGSKVRVTHLASGRSENVIITDRGPFIPERIIDVTIGTANRLGFTKSGITRVKIEVLHKPS